MAYETVIIKYPPEEMWEKAYYRKNKNLKQVEAKCYKEKSIINIKKK